MEASNIIFMFREARNRNKKVLFIDKNDNRIKLDTNNPMELVNSNTIFYNNEIMINIKHLYMVKIIK